jgi:flagellar biosynthesis/type III secretory pathway M-ring protein FliF/YscJ
MVCRSKIGNTAFDMDEQNQPNAPQKYIWPRYVLAGVVLGFVLAFFWMAVLVRRISEQREDMRWPTNTTKPAAQPPVQSATNSPAPTNATPAH